MTRSSRIAAKTHILRIKVEKKSSSNKHALYFMYQSELSVCRITDYTTILRTGIPSFLIYMGVLVCIQTCTHAEICIQSFNKCASIYIMFDAVLCVPRICICWCTIFRAANTWLCLKNVSKCVCTDKKHSLTILLLALYLTSSDIHISISCTTFFSNAFFSFYIFLFLFYFLCWWFSVLPATTLLFQKRNFYPVRIRLFSSMYVCRLFLRHTKNPTLERRISSRGLLICCVSA